MCCKINHEVWVSTNSTPVSKCQSLLYLRDAFFIFRNGIIQLHENTFNLTCQTLRSVQNKQFMVFEVKLSPKNAELYFISTFFVATIMFHTIKYRIIWFLRSKLPERVEIFYVTSYSGLKEVRNSDYIVSF
jgi:hypothetical protein